MSALRAIALALALASAWGPAFAADRPPQFVAIAFDNCMELSRWKELSEFAESQNKAGNPVHFTLFVSGVNFIANEKRALYEGPHERRGYSMIGFGGTKEEVAERIRYINEMRAAGHEIASHAIGHFDGRNWSVADWRQELENYRALVDHVTENNGLSDSARLAFSGASIVGFRAPYLALNPGLYPALKELGFRYDTSDTMAADHWPEKKDGIWRFNLAELRLHRSRKAALSMDYNFFIAQSLGLDSSARREQDRDEMLETYIDYFKANYFGNRAPVHIGHHFTNYHGGAYNEALLAFVERVCGLPEVECVTYSKLADFMDGLSPATLAAYQKGDFPHATQPLVLTGTSAAGLH